MRAKNFLSSRQIFRYAVPARTVTKKHWIQKYTKIQKYEKRKLIRFRPVWIARSVTDVPHWLVAIETG